jgi:hypothetical protein
MYMYVLYIDANSTFARGPFMSFGVLKSLCSAGMLDNGRVFYFQTEVP